jgi:hypothetical protein
MCSCPRCSSADLTCDGHDERGRVVYACGRHATSESASLTSGHRFPRAVILLAVRLWGGKTSRERRSAMLTPCLMFSGSCSQPCKPRRAHARNWCSRTCSYAINSPCSPGRLEADGVLGFAPGTSWRLFWRWKSRSRGGRPHLTPEIRALIATMSRDNRLR